MVSSSWSAGCVSSSASAARACSITSWASSRKTSRISSSSSRPLAVAGAEAGTADSTLSPAGGARQRRRGRDHEAGHRAGDFLARRRLGLFGLVFGGQVGLVDRGLRGGDGLRQRGRLLHRGLVGELIQAAGDGVERLVVLGRRGPARTPLRSGAARLRAPRVRRRSAGAETLPGPSPAAAVLHRHARRTATWRPGAARRACRS